MKRTATENNEFIASLRRERARLRVAHDAGMAGLPLARASSDAMDSALVGLWDLLDPDEGLALVALGGYGRAELSPRSDVDLMVLHDGSRRAGEISEGLFYPLWDAGFVVGHATRTRREALRLGSESLEAETSFLHARLIAGDASLFGSFAADSLAQTRKRRAAFIEDVRKMMRARHASGGSATSQLEPDLKQGAGGLRDLHVLGWLERLDGAPVADGLDAAAELLQRVRNHLHYMSDAATDVLLFHHQRPTATFLGYADGARPAEDDFMRALFTATRSVELVVSSVIADLAGQGAKSGPKNKDGEPFAVIGGRVVLRTEPSLEREPERALDLFAQGAIPGATAIRWLTRALGEHGPIRWTDDVRRAFLALLRAADAQALESADDAGVFAHLLPEWEAVRCQPQHNPYHGFTVDTHLFNTVVAARAIIDDDDPLAREVATDLEDPDALLLAALLHDVGKGAEEDHAVRGERMAGEILARMGVADARRSTIVWLVRHHLLLVEAATRRDLNDENFIVDVAARIGDAERLRLLFLLSIADGRATGPTAWSNWKASLVSELFVKALHVIERGELVSRDASELIRLRTADLWAGLARYPTDQVEHHLKGISRAYILAFPAQTLVKHFALMAEPTASSDARTHVLPTEEAGVYEYTVVARDRPGLFAKVSGVLSLHGLNIVTAQGYTRTDGLAVEVFRCVGEFEDDVSDARWQAVTDDVRRAVRGRLALDARLDEKRMSYTRARKGRGTKPRVVIDNTTSDFLTVVEVHAPDRVGLLYDICAAFAELATDIQVAKVATYGSDVVDVFYVRDLDGQKIVDAEHAAEIERSLQHRLI